MSVMEEHKDSAVAMPHKSIPILVGKDTPGSLLILVDLFAPLLTVSSVLLTFRPKHLEVAEEIDLLSNPFRISMLCTNWKTWETSGIQRLDSLTAS